MTKARRPGVGAPAPKGHDVDPADGPVAAGERVALWAPTLAAEEEFLAAVADARELHHPWVAAPATSEAYRAYTARLALDNQAGFLVRRRSLVDGTPGALVGVVNINNIVWRAFRSGYLGYYAFSAGAGQGLMTEAVGLVVDHAFSTLGLHRLEANIQPANVASTCLVQRLGFRLEGFSPGYLYIDGAWRDHERWAIVVGQGPQFRTTATRAE